MVMDLSELKNTSTESPSLDSLSDEERARLDDLAESVDLPKNQVPYAFLVYKDPDAGWIVSHDLTLADQIESINIPDGEVLLAAFANLQSDLQAEKTASTTLMLMQKMAQAQIVQAQNQRLAQGLNLKR